MGYDVLSFNEDGSERHIEVKTTSGARDKPFDLTYTELAYSIKYPEKFMLYRLYNFDDDTGTEDYYIIEGDLLKACDLIPTAYKARPK